KDENQRETLNTVLFRAVETLRWLSVLLYPVMPETSRAIYRQIGLTGDVSETNPENLKWSELSAETKIGEIEPLFPRLDKKKIMDEIQNSQQSTVNTEQKSDVQTTNNEQRTTDEDGFITIDDFLKVELRVGEIKVAERIPKSDKLLRFEIDLGEEKPRQILAGLAEYYEPEKLIGRKVVVVANLKPRKMRGLESQGMVCAASLNEEDTPALAAFLEDVKIGARLK
ncbi:MAG TPA: methionine--tRNA ligase subunit beta, partial [Pyrinomonadaceae bacterium]